MENRNKMGTGRIGPLIFSMAVPAMLSMLINALYNIVDSIFVAQYSSSALAAVSLVFPLQQIVIAIAVGTGIGVNSLIARRLGEKRQKDAEDVAEHGLVLSILTGVVFIVLGLFASGLYLRLFAVSDSVMQQAMIYSKIAVGCSMFQVISIMAEKVQQSTGHMIVPMVQGIVGAVVNIILDPLMIFGIGPFPEMGVAGAALATVIGQITGFAVGLWGMFVHQKILHLSLKGFRMKGKVVGDIYKVGLPSIVMQSVASFMTTGINKILLTFSESAVSVFGIYFKLQTFIFMPVYGINQGSLPVIGYNYGARDKKRMMSAYRVALYGAVVIMILGTVIFQKLPAQMIALFSSDPELIAIGVPALKNISWSFIGAAFCIVNVTIFQATGHGVASLVVSVARQIIIILPVAWLLARMQGLDAVWFAFPIAEYIAVVLSGLFLIRLYKNEISKLEPIRKEEIA